MKFTPFAGLLFWAFEMTCCASYALPQEITIAQLRSFLLNQHKSKISDSDTANRLSSVWLSERLTDPELSSIIAGSEPGPEAVEQLRLLAHSSVFAAPPESEILALPPPSPDQQRAILSGGTEYVQTALRHLPDFLALRVTRRFENTPMAVERKHKAKMQMRWIGEFKNQITYRKGTEIMDDSSATDRASPELSTHAGLLSMGEFGPILRLVFNDFKQGSIEWARWESDPLRGRLAVYHYTVPKSASHYLVDFCCYTTLKDETRELSYRDHPAYHGEVIFSPDSGAVVRITIEADLDASAPIITSQLAVQYSDVEIGGRTYVCPVQSIAMTALHNPQLERINGVGIERHLNEVQFRDYHKFGSTSRVITSP